MKRSHHTSNAVLLAMSVLLSSAVAEIAIRLLKPQQTHAVLVELAGT